METPSCSFQCFKSISGHSHQRLKSLYLHGIAINLVLGDLVLLLLIAVGGYLVRITIFRHSLRVWVAITMSMSL